MKAKNNVFSQILADLRKENNLSQVGLATALAVDPSTIAKYETGDRLPDIFMLSKIADFFSVSTDYLLGRVNYC